MADSQFLKTTIILPVSDIYDTNRLVRESPGISVALYPRERSAG